MVPPKSVTEAGKKPKAKSEVTIFDLVLGDAVLEKKILEVSNDENPPIFFRWHEAGLSSFWTKAVAYGMSANAHAPPVAINAGAHPVGEPDLSSLKVWISEYVSNGGERGIVIGGPGTPAGLTCTLYQCSVALQILSRLEVDEPWFRGVIEHGSPLLGPLATLFGRSDCAGVCFAISSGSPLWQCSAPI
jgi:hypothetical protein